MQSIHPSLSAALMLLASAVAPARAVSLEEVRQETPAAVERLPVLGRVGQGGQPRLVIRGTLAPKRAREILQMVRAVQTDVLRRFGGADEDIGGEPRKTMLFRGDGVLDSPLEHSKPDIQICLFATTAGYEAFVGAVFGPDTFQADLGFFSPYRRLVGVDLERRGQGVLRHELVHALQIDAPGKLPYWVEEGLAGLYVDAERSGSGFRFRAGHRLAELKRLRKAGRLPGLDALVASDDRQVYGPNWRAYYALGRYLLLYLERRGRLEAFCRDLRAGPLTPARQLGLIEGVVNAKAFWRWVEGL